MGAEIISTVERTSPLAERGEGADHERGAFAGSVGLIRAEVLRSLGSVRTSPRDDLAYRSSFFRAGALLSKNDARDACCLPMRVPLIWVAVPLMQYVERAPSTSFWCSMSLPAQPALEIAAIDADQLRRTAFGNT
jgi:hypothetical protein